MELNELQRLVQKLQSLESNQLVNNGDLQRIISMQVSKMNRLEAGLYQNDLSKRSNMCLTHRIFFLKSLRRSLARFGVTLAHCLELRRLEW